MSYELWLGVRYLVRRRRERFVSVIALLSIGGVALGVMAMLVVLAVMSGFDHDLKEKLVATNAHLTLEAGRQAGQETDQGKGEEGPGQAERHVMSCNQITCQRHSRVISGFPPETDSMIPRPTAMTRPMATQAGDTWLRTPPYQSAASAPIRRMK